MWAASMRANAVFTGRAIGATRPRAVTRRMAATDLLMLVSSFHTVPSHQPWCGPIGRDGFDQPASGIFGGKGDALGLAGFDGERIQPERLPAVIEPVQQPEMMTVQMEHGGNSGAVGQGQYHRAAFPGTESGLGVCG